MKFLISLYTFCFIMLSGCKEVICEQEGHKGVDNLGPYVYEDCQPWYYERKPTLMVRVADADDRFGRNNTGEIIVGQLVKLFSNELDYKNNRNAIDSAITNDKGTAYFKHIEPLVYYIRSEKGCRSSFGLWWGGVDLTRLEHRRVFVSLYRSSSQIIFLNNQTNDSCFAFINDDAKPSGIGPKSIYTERRPADTNVNITVIRNMADTSIKTYKWTTNRPCGTDTTLYIN
jgi:hypothetical protein